MGTDAIRWDHYPTVARAEGRARGWDRRQIGSWRGTRLRRTIGRWTISCASSIEKVNAEDATRAHVAAYVGDLLARANPRRPKVVHLDSGAGLANATILRRLSVIRLFFDRLVEEGSAQPILPAGCSGVDGTAEHLTMHR